MSLSDLGQAGELTDALTDEVTPAMAKAGAACLLASQGAFLGGHASSLLELTAAEVFWAMSKVVDPPIDTAENPNSDHPDKAFEGAKIARYFLPFSIHFWVQ